jgi:thiamine biosynthesis lipoprotein
VRGSVRNAPRRWLSDGPRAPPELATADAYATAAYAMGPDFGPPWTARLRGYEAMTILESGTVLSTAGFPSD